MGLEKKQKRCVEKLYYEMYYPLSAYAKSALNDHSLAEEAVQDTFRIACAKINDLIASPNPKGWLTITLKNVINNMIRSRARLKHNIVASLDADESISVVTDETQSITSSSFTCYPPSSWPYICTNGYVYCIGDGTDATLTHSGGETWTLSHRNQITS